MGVVAFIPAKMTSRRLPRKNLLGLCGRPLLYYSVRAALLTEAIDRVIVSSESEEALAAARGYGAETLTRPERLSRHGVTTAELLRHSYPSFQDGPDTVVLLQPTHPLRDPGDIHSAIGLLETSGADSLFAVVRTDELRGSVEGGLFRPEFPLPRDKAAEPEAYRNTGSFYVFRPERTFLGERPFGKRIAAYVLGRPEFEVDIDTASDLRLAECLLRTHAAEFPHFEVA